MTELQRVYYVEDEADIRFIADIALRQVGGLEVLISSEGETAIKDIEEFHPQLILLDVMMPGLDGPTTLEMIRSDERFAHIPAIFLTAKVQEDEVAYFKGLGAIGVIAKPFSPMTLADEIKHLWQLSQSADS